MTLFCHLFSSKSLVDFNQDKDAIIELTLHKIKKNAIQLGNEYSIIETSLAEVPTRSDSQMWISEQHEKYPDYTRTVYSSDLYMKPNPNRLSKSTLFDIGNPVIKRRIEKKKIYFECWSKCATQSQLANNKKTHLYKSESQLILLV